MAAEAEEPLAQVRVSAIAGGGRGLFCTQPLDEGDVVARDHPLALVSSGSEVQHLRCAGCWCSLGSLLAQLTLLGTLRDEHPVDAQALARFEANVQAQAVPEHLREVPLMRRLLRVPAVAVDGPAPAGANDAAGTAVYCCAECRDRAPPVPEAASGGGAASPGLIPNDDARAAFLQLAARQDNYYLPLAAQLIERVLRRVAAGGVELADAAAELAVLCGPVYWEQKQVGDGSTGAGAATGWARTVQGQVSEAHALLCRALASALGAAQRAVVQTAAATDAQWRAQFPRHVAREAATVVAEVEEVLSLQSLGRTMGAVAHNAIAVRFFSPLVPFVLRCEDDLSTLAAEGSTAERDAIVRFLAPLLRAAKAVQEQERACTITERKKGDRNAHAGDEDAVEDEEEDDEESDDEDEDSDDEDEMSSDEDSFEEDETYACSWEVAGETEPLSFDSGLFPSSTGSGVFPMVASLNHSCDPNTEVICVASNEAALITTRAVRADEELLISYIATDRPLRERRAALRRHYGFDCCCTRCEAEAEEEEEERSRREVQEERNVDQRRPAKRARATGPS